MSEVTRRTLMLLSLLQSRSVWSGPDLAAELGVTTRCIRRDVDRLRELGYPVIASSGHGGGYQLGAGRALPPLLLGDEEATAVAIGLRMAAASGIDGLGEHALRALTALEGILPPTVRAKVLETTGVLDVVSSTTAHIGPPILQALAAAVRDGVQARLDYRRADGHRSTRRIEPYRVLSLSGRWYLFAWDLDREDWRTFRLDRMLEARATTFRFAPRTTPDIEAYVRESVSVRPYPDRIRVRIHAAKDDVAACVPAWGGTITADGENRCIVQMGATDLRWAAMQLAAIGMPLEVLDPPELHDVLDELAAWFAAHRSDG
ncbi:MAG: YafY family protein [Brachybacterium sp.]|nr:YafY family protein [Brachybacterium sp.]